MRRVIIVCLAATILGFQALSAQTADQESLLAGVNFIRTSAYSQAQNDALLKLYQGLRVADVTDGLDMVGLPDRGLVNPAIHAAWIDLDSLKHHFCGIALTLRYVPSQRPDRPAPGEDFSQWESRSYRDFTSEAFTDILRPGDAVVIDDVDQDDIGSIGSSNILRWFEKGARGVVTDASSRDTDEVAKERVPLYFLRPGRGIRPGRNELESINRPVEIGGVLVCPGDVVVADGDGVVIVPRAVAEKVALFARGILDSDKQGRLQLYQRLGLPPDKTVK